MKNKGIKITALIIVSIGTVYGLYNFYGDYMEKLKSLERKPLFSKTSTGTICVVPPCF